MYQKSLSMNPDTAIVAQNLKDSDKGKEPIEKIKNLFIGCY